MWKLFNEKGEVLDIADDFRTLLIKMENRAAAHNNPVPIIKRIDYDTGDHIDHVYGNLYVVFGRGGRQLGLKTVDACNYYSTLNDPFSLEIELIRWRTSANTLDDLLIMKISFENGYHAEWYEEWASVDADRTCQITKEVRYA